jgi:raffinose/stachyose/melibiose transport system permease protein
VTALDVKPKEVAREVRRAPGSGGRERRRGRSGRARLIGTHGILVAFTLFALFPFFSILLASFYPTSQAATGLQWPRSWDFRNYVRAWDAAGFSVLMRNSAIVAVCVVVVGSTVCILAGYAFGTMQFRFRGTLFGIFLIGLLMPFEATIIPLYYGLRSVGLANTHEGLVLPETALFLSFGVFWMRANFQAAERSLIEAARIDGATSWRTLWKVLVPTARPAIATMMVLLFIWSWNEFLLALVLAQNPNVETAPAGIGLLIGQYTTQYSLLAAAAIIMTVPALIVYVLLQRHFIQGMTSGSVKG